MLTSGELMKILAPLPADTEVRIGDVAEQDELHCSTGKVMHRSRMVIFITGSDEIWRDETLASEVLAEQLWPEEDSSED
jgi:hypothetical protein